MSYSKHIGSIAVGIENNYCSVANGVPGAAALSSAFVSMELADRAQITPYGEPVVTERMSARDGMYGQPPEPVRVGSTDSIMRRATITLDAWYRPIGGPVGSIATYPGMPLYRLLRTRFDEHLPAVGTSDPVAAPLGTAGQWTPTVAGDYTIGEVLRVVTAAAPHQSRYTTVTDKTAAPLIICSPQLDAAPPVGTVVYPLPTLHLPRAGSTSLLTCALQINGEQYQATCYGVVMTGLSINGTSDDGRAVRVSMTLDAGWVEYDPAGSPPAPEVLPSGAICRSLSADAVLSVPVDGSAAPVSAARAYEALGGSLCLDAWTVQVAWTMAYPGCGGAWSGRATPEATDVDVTAELTLSRYTVDNLDFNDRAHRTLVLGMSAADDGPGEGGCVVVPAAYRKSEGLMATTDGELLRQKLTLGAGRYAGDDDTTGLANSILRIALG